MNHYAVLGIPIDADDLAIRSAFRELARRYHPDAGEGSSSEKFRRIVEAYETLTDPKRRSSYDRSLRNASRAHTAPIEPLVSPVEPVFPRRRTPGWTHMTNISARTSRSFDELFDDLWRAIEDDFFWR
jgi:curved DNA-binding protein CbpA